jgi:hypothetical protein
VILAGKTVTVTFADGRSATVDITNRDELRFEQREKVSLAKVVSEADDAAPLWVIAGIVHWRMLRSDVADIPAAVDEFVDQLAVDDWLEVVETGKVTASDSDPPTG